MADLPVALAHPLHDLGDAPYDHHAKVYDRLIGAPLYNRLIWRARVSDYAAFAAEAVADGDGPMLDAGCGTAVFSADAYRAASRPLILADRSRGMLDRAAERVGRRENVWYEAPWVASNPRYARVSRDSPMSAGREARFDRGMTRQRARDCAGARRIGVAGGIFHWASFRGSGSSRPQLLGSKRPASPRRASLRPRTARPVQADLLDLPFTSEAFE
jgi:hypothetical protein